MFTSQGIEKYQKNLSVINQLKLLLLSFLGHYMYQTRKVTQCFYNSEYMKEVHFWSKVVHTRVNVWTSMRRIRVFLSPAI